MDTLIKIKVKINQNHQEFEISILKHDTIKKLKEEIEKKNINTRPSTKFSI